MTTFRQSQEDELEAVANYFGESLVAVDLTSELLQGQITVELEPSNAPITLFVTTSEGRKHFSTKYLSPIQLLFRLPVDYPMISAELDIECSWISSQLVTEIRRELDVMASENIEFPLLFLSCQTIKEFFLGRVINEICLDRNPYSINNGLSGEGFLKMVRDSCEEYEMSWFKSHCHECEVCFDIKPGPESVKFSPCSHIFCKDCVRSYFQSRLSEQQVAPLSCLSNDCLSYPSESLIIDIVGQEQFDRYQRIILRNAIMNMQDFAQCPRVHCQNPAQISTATSNLATCLSCNFCFCTKCHKAYHGVDPCRRTAITVSRMVENEDGSLTFKKVTVDEYLAADESQRKEMAEWYGGLDKLEAVMDEAMGRSEQRSLDWLQKYTRKCPVCGMAIILEDGCNHVFCPCGASFCYGCGEIFKSEGTVKSWQAWRREFIPCAHVKTS
ncbi:hypothetical protein KIN20_016334 [Parelaphostrongylus tenuis]|uniref:RBR-type E3 ubiquitin transferase n=1 Tax=Parelaphostrongylus tenuis TaxID=148309 RepID=A0AAD5QQM5_PARTN|nr:hypothetical protein KIN20_016334 [Parelaphostrongylus tenuis]